MPVTTIRSLAHELFEQLTKERSFDATTGYELGRLSAALTMITGGPPVRDPSMRTRATDAHAPLPPPTKPASIAVAEAPPRSTHGQFAPKTNGKRVRVEKRPMRRARRILTGPAGHVIVYDFERLQVNDSPASGSPTVETVATRKELWDHLKKRKREFRKLGAGKVTAA